MTVAEIARAADVSEQTVFNYFPTKEDLVYWRLGAFEDELLAAIRDRAPGESALAAFGRFLLAQRGLLGQPTPRRASSSPRSTRMITESPALLAREQQIFAGYTASLAALLAEETRRRRRRRRAVGRGQRADGRAPRARALTRGAGSSTARATRAWRPRSARRPSGRSRLLEGGLGDYARQGRRAADATLTSPSAAEGRPARGPRSTASSPRGTSSSAGRVGGVGGDCPKGSFSGTFAAIVTPNMPMTYSAAPAITTGGAPAAPGERAPTPEAGRPAPSP